MENASKALLIAGGILVGILILSIGVYLFNNYRDVGITYEQSLSATEIEKFNSNFTKFEGRDDITIHEILTLANFAKQYEEQTGLHVAIKTSTGTAFDDDLVNFLKRPEINDEFVIEIWIKRNLNKEFKCESIWYNDAGRVQGIRFRKT